MKRSPKAPQPLKTTAATPEPLATAAALDAHAFAPLIVTEAIPDAWEDRARKAWEFFTTDPLVANVVNTWLDFAVGEDIRLTCDDATLQKQAQDAYWALGLDTWVRDMLLQLLVKGDCIGYVRLDHQAGGVLEVNCVNPVSVKVAYFDGELRKVTQYSEPIGGGGITLGQGIDLPVEQITHRKWNAPSYAQRGNSLILPAFHALTLLGDYRKADQAIAKRWTTPLRFIKVGGRFGDQVIVPDAKMLDSVRDAVNRMDLRSGLVVPFWVTAETFGNQGEVLATEARIREVKEDIMVALGLSRALVTGDGPNYSTALVSLRKMLITVKRLRQVAKDLLYWVFDRWLALQGKEQAALEFVFPDLNIVDRTEANKLLLEMFDRGLVSKKTVQGLMDLNPGIEEANREGEKKVDKRWTMQDIVLMVQLGIMSVATAQSLLGMDAREEEYNSAAFQMNDINRLYSRAAGYRTGKMCDDCQAFNESNNHCDAKDIEIPFDTPACVLFDQKMTPEDFLPLKKKADQEGGDCGCGGKQS